MSRAEERKAAGTGAPEPAGTGAREAGDSRVRGVGVGSRAPEAGESCAAEAGESRVPEAGVGSRARGAAETRAAEAGESCVPEAGVGSRARGAADSRVPEVGVGSRAAEAAESRAAEAAGTGLRDGARTGGRDAYGTGASGGERGGTRRPSPLWALALFRSELTTTLRRWRTRALLGVLALIPILIGVAVKIETSDGGNLGGGHAGDGQGPAFFSQITNNGIFLVFASLAATLPVFLPMVIGVIAGDAIAGEAGAGTLRYLLVAPAGRTRLLLAKFTTTMAFCLISTLIVALSGLVTGALLFPLGDVTLISGITVPFEEALLRALGVAAVVALSLVGIATAGLFISTLTNSGIAAMATTVGLVVTVQILDTIPQLHAIHPYLFPHYWLSFADLLREPVYWDQLIKNMGLQGLYVAVFGSAAWARFTAKDITA